MQFANTETNEVEQLSINKFFSWNFKENLKLCVTTLYIHTHVEKIHLKGMKRKLVENFFSKRILSVLKIWSNAFQLDYLPFCVFVDNLQRCSIVPLYALLEEGQNDPICDGSNFLSMYKKEMRSAFLISFYLHNSVLGVKVFPTRHA